MSNSMLFSIMDKAMQGICQAEASNNLVCDDPFVRDALDELSDLLVRVKSIDPELAEQIDDATGLLASAFENCGVLYGLQISEAFRAVVQDPAGFNQHVYERVNRGRKAGACSKAAK